MAPIGVLALMGLERPRVGVMRLNRTVATALAALLMLTVSPVWAQQADEPEDTDQEAREAFQGGVEKFHEKDYGAAVALFRRAYELSPTWKLYFNIGQCEAALKRYGLALDAFEAYLVSGGDEIPPDRVEIVLSEIDRMTRLVGELEVVAPDGSEVFVDGLFRGMTPFSGPIRVSAGLRKIEVRQGDAVVLSQELRVLGRGKNKVEAIVKTSVEPPKPEEALPQEQKEPEVVPEEGEPQPLPKDYPPLLSWGWAMGGTGAAVLLAGAVTGALAVSQYSELKEACPNKICGKSSDFELKDQVDRLQVATNVLLPLGAALAATGIVLIIIGTKNKQRGLEVAPVLGTQSAGIFVKGGF
jgi:tetratricopeptide (TPR) repeat protein